jgi:hypothetical protein
MQKKNKNKKTWNMKKKEKTRLLWLSPWFHFERRRLGVS